MRPIAMLANYLRSKPTAMLLLVMLFALLLRISILYPSYANGMPAGYDTYIHAASAYFIANGGLEASPTSPFYPPLFLILLAFLYQVTGIAPIYLILPVGIIIDVLCIFPMFYIVRRISGNDEATMFLGAFFTALNPVSIMLLILGSLPSMFSMLGLLTLVAVLVSGIRDRPIGVILMGLLGAFIALTNILVLVFYVLLVAGILVYELVLKRANCYSKSLLLSALIAAPLSGIFYIPRLGYFYSGLFGGEEYILWVLPTLTITLVLILPIAFLFRVGLRKEYISTPSPHLKLLKLWYLTTPIMGLVFIWQVAVESRLWHFITFPAIVVLAIVFVRKFNLMKKAGKRRAAKRAATLILVACFTLTYINSMLVFQYDFHGTPDRLDLMNWIETRVSQDARFCTEEEYLPTHLGWYIMGLTGRMAYESITSFTGVFEVGTDVAWRIALANNITRLNAGSPYWVQALKELQVTFVVLLESSSHLNYASISDKVVFSNDAYVVYNVTEYVFP